MLAGLLMAGMFAAAMVAVILLTGATSPPAALAQGGRKIAPDFTLDRCVNADTLTLSEYRAQPVVLFFFDLGDVANDIAYRYVRNWHQKYPEDEVVTVGIHCPMYEPLKAWGNAATVVGREYLKFPIAMDMDHKVCMKYGIEHLPTFILVEPGGAIAFQTSETSEYGKMERMIQKVIKDIEPDAIVPFFFEPKVDKFPPGATILPPTPRIEFNLPSESIADCDSSSLGQFKVYADSYGREHGRAYLHGRWKVAEGALVYEDSEESYVRIIYSGRDVWILPGFPSGQIATVYLKQDRSYLKDAAWGRDVKLDRTSRPHVIMRHAVPVHIVSNQDYGTHELRLIPTEGDVAFHYIYFAGSAVK